MVVSDLYVVRVSITPGETDPPLLIDPDAPLARTVSKQLFETIGGRNAEVVQSRRGIEHSQLTQCYPVQTRRNAPRPLQPEQPLRLAIAPALNQT